MATTTPPPLATTTALRLTQGTALFLSTLTSGISLSLSCFVIPRLLESPTSIMLTQWTRTYARGHATVPTTAAVVAATYLFLGLRASSSPLSFSSHARWGYFGAGALTIAIVPYTLLFMLGTNGKLMEMEKRVAVRGEASVVEGAVKVEEERSAKALVDWWGVLNLGRAVLLIGGAVCGFVATL